MSVKYYIAVEKLRVKRKSAESDLMTAALWKTEGSTKVNKPRRARRGLQGATVQ
jgi:hypothetical protein